MSFSANTPPSDRPAPGIAPGGPAFKPLGPAGAAPLLEKAKASARSGVLEVMGEGGSVARISLRSGRVVEARSGATTGREAVLRIFLWTSAQYRWVEETGREPAPPELETEALVTEGLRRRAVWQLMLRELPPLEGCYLVDFHRLSLRLEDLPVVARDLCRLFDGRRSLADVFADAGLPELEAASIVGHLLGAGIIADAAGTDPAAAARLQTAPTRQNLAALPLEGPVDGAPALPAVSSGPDDDTPVVGALEHNELTDVIVVRPPPPARPVRLATVGLALGVGAALVFGLARLPRRTPPPQALRAPSAAGSSAETPRQRVLPAQDTVRLTHVAAAPAPKSVSPQPASRRLCLRAADGALARGTGAACEKALAEGGPQADVLSVLARAALEQGRFGAAAARARQAVALDPALPEAYAYLGFAEAELGRRAAALAAYRRYLALAPHGRLAQDIRAIVAR